MRTNNLLQTYKRNPDTPKPHDLWQKLVWMAAELLRAAETERGTSRAPMRPRAVKPRLDASR